MKLLFFDTETTDIKPGYICQLSYIIVDTTENKTIGKNFYFAVPTVSQGAYNTHNLSVKKLFELSKGATFKDKYKEIIADFSSVNLIIGHNVKFDMNFINTEIERAGGKTLIVDTFCTMSYYTNICKLKNKWGNRKPPKLEEAIKFLNIPKELIEKTCIKLFGDFMGYHDSRYDIAGTYLLLTEGIKQGYMERGYFTQNKTL